MSPRRNRTGDSADRSSATPAPMGSSLRRVESYRGEDWVVQTVAGSPGRYYRCPGCDQEIPPGVGHVVAWPDHGARWRTGGTGTGRAGARGSGAPRPSSAGVAPRATDAASARQASRDLSTAAPPSIAASVQAPQRKKPASQP